MLAIQLPLAAQTNNKQEFPDGPVRQALYKWFGKCVAAYREDHLNTVKADPEMKGVKAELEWVQVPLARARNSFAYVNVSPFAWPALK